MKAAIDMFLFLFKSKYRRKRMVAVDFPLMSLLLLLPLPLSLLPLVPVSATTVSAVADASPDICKDVECGNGVCVNGTCVCHDGWQGSQCQYCGGKVKLNGTSGHISDGVGNYSLDVKCSWLIEAGNSTNSTIRLHFEEFITECGWDHLYIYDGDSVHSPLLGVYSGLMYSKDYSLQSIPEIVAHSGFALLHFYSDIAYNLSGFNITYSLNTCPSTTSSKDCSGHGICIESVCTCDAQFTGEACHIPICPNKCTASNGVCDQEQHRCVCNPKYKGDDCSQVAEHGYWEVLKTSDFVPQGSASHTAVVWQDSMYIVGGESFKKGHMLYVYDFNGHVWETPHVISKTSPTIRYGHSSVLFGDKIYIYGGVKEDGSVCNELWAYDISAKSWENVTVNTGSCERNLMNIGFTNQALCGPLRSAGHTATLVPPSYIAQSSLSGSGPRYVTERMIIIFGHSPTYGFLNFVQEYYFGTREWAVVKTKGYPVKGGYGHSAAWDPVTERILVYGGYVSMSPTQSALSSKLYAYDPYLHTWYLMSSGPNGRFLHSGSMLSPAGGLMLIYGGNIHNDTGINLVSSDGQCYTAQPLLYDTYCDSWTQMTLPSNLFTSLMRFGHSAITFEKSTYIYGGFNGQMLNDILKFSPGNCSSNNMMINCLNSHQFGVKCIWDNKKSVCLPLSDIPAISPTIDFESTYSRCPEESKSKVKGIYVQCNQQTTCESCVHTHRCGWCPLLNSCVHDIQQCTAMNKDDMPYRIERPITSGYQCANENTDHMRCNHLHSCQSCVTHTGCHWDSKQEIAMCIPITNYTSIPYDLKSPDVCESVCDHYTECTNCTKDECIWCQNNERCIDKNAYTSSFPYGQCREWTTDEHRCRTSPGNSQCNFYRTCVDCRDDPECGWCDDGSGTGLGSCMAGGNTPPQSCSQNKWYFTHCPTCQCNGHSTCMNNTDICIHPCSNNTEGPNCETCIKGFYGNPVNGGECKECKCNNQGNYCNNENGKCYCTTKGIIGDNCEKCDTNNHYLGDPSNHGSCFYDLTIDYQFTFNLSKKDDLKFTQINFQNSPSKSDVDADFSITCSVAAKMNITVKTAYGQEKMLLPLQNCSNFRTKFLKSEYMFGTDGNMSLTTFYVYVYDFKPPLWIQISFSQYPKLNLQQFFITFSSCFLLLLLVAAILWKLKQKYDMYRRRQRMFVEMEQMASRPFSVVEVEIEKRNTAHSNQIPTISVSNNLRKRKVDVPNPVALEPCAGNKAAVLTLLVRQPTGNDRYTPHGYSGLAIASALVVVGNVQQSKTSGIDNGSSPLPGKEDVRWTGRGLKASQHPSEARI